MAGVRKIWNWATRQEIRQEQNHTDPYSNQPLEQGFSAHLDHKNPLGKGGSDTRDNLQYLNIDTHDRKHQVEDGYSPAKSYGWKQPFQRAFFYDMFKGEDQPE